MVQKNDPEVLDLILEADRRSIARNNGHGNAIAQVYNHIIMPLATQHDQDTQIIWGLKHFEHTLKEKLPLYGLQKQLSMILL